MFLSQDHNIEHLMKGNCKNNFENPVKFFQIFSTIFVQSLTFPQSSKLGKPFCVQDTYVESIATVTAK